MVLLSQHGLDRVLLDLALLFALCIVVVVVFHRLRIPPIAGFLVAGALVGPHSLGLIAQPELVEYLAEVGVVVLLFTVGMELSLRELLRMRRALLLGGGIQLGLTIGLGAAAAILAGLPWGTALLLGFLLSLSSTAVVAKLLQDRGELGSPPGRLAMSICVAQDLAVVPMILVLPLLAGGMGEGAAALDDALWRVGRSFLLLLLAMGAAWVLVPRLLDLVAKTRSREVFVLTIVMLCLTGATVTAMLGLSLALGAFLIGLILAGSHYHHQATAEVEPFRDALSSLFFVSIGMLFDPAVIVASPGVVALALAAVVLGKAVVVFTAARLLSLPGWVALRTGLLLAQVGEFSFVVIQVARGSALELGGIESVFLVVAVMSIGLTPLLLLAGRRLTRRSAKAAGVQPAEARDPRRDHVVIVGFGPGGRAVAQALRNRGIAFVVIEMNAETVNDFRQRQYPIFLGDASREAVLRAAGLVRARLLVLATNDTEATRHTAALARRIAPDIHIVARTSFISEVPALQRLGVHEIVPQELETSIEIMVRVLAHYLVPDDEVGREVHAVRAGAHLPERGRRPKHQQVDRLAEILPGVAVEVVGVTAGSAIAGRTLLESGLRRLSGCTVVAIKRGADVDIAVHAGAVLQVGDVAVVIGPKERIGEAAELFAAPGDAGAEPGIATAEGSCLIGKP